MRLLILFLVLVCCNKLQRGQIIDKHYEPATTRTILVPMIVGKIHVMRPQVIYDDEDWVLTVKGIYDGEERIENIFVSPSCYRLNIGDTWVKDEDCSYSDDNNRSSE